MLFTRSNFFQKGCAGINLENLEDLNQHLAALLNQLQNTIHSITENYNPLKRSF